MYNIHSDVARKPDPPGDEDFVHRYVDSHFDTTGSMSTMTDPPPSVSQLDKHCSSFSIPKNISTLSTINEEGCSLDVSSNDPPMMDKNDIDTLRLDDVLLSTMSFPYHSFMVKYIREYATSQGFLHLHKCKNHFTSEAALSLFPGDISFCSLESNPSQDKKYPRSGFFSCSTKSQGRTKGINCSFHLNYMWDSSNKSFKFSHQSSNISHNHQLLPQLTCVDGCVIVNFEQSLTHDEFLSIREQSRCRVQVPQMRVNLEEYFPHRSFSATMLYRMRDKFFTEKYGADGHNLPDLFMKGERIRRLGGLFIVVPSTTDFSIETIHGQTKLMGEYARVYGVDGFKMADGTHKITKYDMTFVFWIVVDCLLRSKFVGYTANFTENSNVIIDGAVVFFKQEAIYSTDSADENKCFVGGIAGYFDPFVDNEIDIASTLLSDDNVPDAKHASMPLSDDNLHNSLSSKSLYRPDIVTSPSKTAFMTDEGSAFPSVAERFGWMHLLDRRHFATQILAAWHGLSDPQQFQSDVYDILDTPSVDTLMSLLNQALTKYRTEKAQVFLNKIYDKQHQLCYAHTCNFFTAGHVSDQRMEQGMAAMKANGKLKSYLSECTYGEAVSRISQVARDQDITALKELQTCRENHKKVGLRYADALKNAKVASLKYSSVQQINPLFTTQFLVKEKDTNTVACQVNLDTTILWRGEQFRIVTGTCSYFLSTRMICPCACAAMQRVSMDIDKIDNVHPFYRIWYHPLWKEAIKSLYLSDYKDSPYSSSGSLEPISNVPVQDPSCSIDTEDTMQRFNSEIFDKIGHLGNISEAKRIHKMREQFNMLEKIAVKSVQATKYAICGIIEVTNRLGSLSLNSTNLNIQVSAVSKALQRHQKHSLENSSTLNFLKRKANPQSSVISGQQSKRNCRICRDQFKEPQEIYSSHRGNSSKCPHYNGLPQPANTVNTILSSNDNLTMPSTEVMCTGNTDNKSELTTIGKPVGETLFGVVLTNSLLSEVSTIQPVGGGGGLSGVPLTPLVSSEHILQTTPLSPCKVNPIQYEFPHKSTDEAKVILRTYGTLQDVPADGSCGYHSIMLLLRRMQLIDNNLSVTEFRCGIHDFILSNMVKFVGVSADGSDCVFQFPWGSMDRVIKQHRNPAASRKRYMTTKVLSGIWCKNVSYLSFVSIPHWMDAGHLLPVIVYKYQIEQLVLYDNSGTHMISVDGSRCFRTVMYRYDKSKGCVSNNVLPGLVYDIVASGNACMVYLREESHFMLFEYFDPPLETLDAGCKDA